MLQRLLCYNDCYAICCNAQCAVCCNNQYARATNLPTTGAIGKACAYSYNYRHVHGHAHSHAMHLPIVMHTHTCAGCSTRCSAGYDPIFERNTTLRAERYWSKGGFDRAWHGGGTGRCRYRARQKCFLRAVDSSSHALVLASMATCAAAHAPYLGRLH